MKASDIITSLEHLIQIKQPTFLWGAPGVGKSQIVAKVAHNQNKELIDVRAVLLDPVDLRGLPTITKDGSSSWAIPDFFPKSGSGILFLDELNAAPPLVQAACYQLVLDRKLGDYTLPDGWSILAAGNREKDRAVTHRMPSALANRFTHIEFEVNMEEWLLWADENNIPSEIKAFIRFRPQLLHNFSPESDSKAFASPRSWQFAAKIVGCNLPEATEKELLAGTIGTGATTEFSAFCKIARQIPTPEQIFAEAETIAIPHEPALLFAIIEMVSRASHLGVAQQLISYAQRLPAEFSVLLMREAVRNCREIAKYKSFALWAQQHAAILL